MCIRNYLTHLFLIIGCIFNYSSGRDWTTDRSPYIVSIRDDCYTDCIGSIVTFKKVVTAASCMDKPDKTKYNVVAGVANLHNMGEYRQERKVVDVAFPNDRYALEFNIAVVEVDTEFNPSPRVDTIELCSRSFDTSTEMEVIRWGREFGEEFSNQLQSNVLTAYAHGYCARSFLLHDIFFAPTMTCAANPTIDRCYVNAGTPGIVNEKLCAVASHNLRCENTNLPTAFIKGDVINRVPSGKSP